MSKIKIGQIWMDWDSRIRTLPPRLLKVIRFPNDLMVEVENIKTKRKTVISKHRMVPNSRGYELYKNVKLGLFLDSESLIGGW